MTELRHDIYRDRSLGRAIQTEPSGLGPATRSSGNIALEPEVGSDYSGPFPAEGNPDATIPYCLNSTGPGPHDQQALSARGLRDRGQGGCVSLLHYLVKIEKPKMHVNKTSAFTANYKRAVACIRLH